MEWIYFTTGSAQLYADEGKTRVGFVGEIANIFTKLRSCVLRDVHVHVCVALWNPSAPSKLLFDEIALNSCQKLEV
jgi:hypothetical protein